MKSRKPKAGEQGGGLTARMTQGSQRSQECSELAAALEAAVREGIDQGLDDHILMAGVTRVLELQQRAAEQAAAAKEAYEARAALAAAPIRTPRSREWRAFGGAAHRATTLDMPPPLHSFAPPLMGTRRWEDADRSSLPPAWAGRARSAAAWTGPATSALAGVARRHARAQHGLRPHS